MRIENDGEYREALQRIDAIFSARTGGRLDRERERLAGMIEEYEDREYPEFRRARGNTRLFLLAGPSGAGKDAIIAGIRQQDRGVHFPVTTTRPPRAGEEHGREYIFLSQQEFHRMELKGEFLETAQVHGHSYGTPCAEVLDPLARQMDVLLKIDVQGAALVREKRPDALGIFIMPESTAQLRARLEARGLERDDLETRMDNARREIIRGYREFQWHVINRQDRLDETIREVMRVVREGPRGES